MVVYVAIFEVLTCLLVIGNESVLTQFRVSCFLMFFRVFKMFLVGLATGRAVVFYE